MDKRTKWLWLTLNAGISRSKIRKMLDDIGSIDNIYDAGKSDFAALSYLDEKNVSALLDKNTSNLDTITGIMDKYRVRLLTVDMDEYPTDLKQTDDHPVLLYVRGKELDLNDHLCVAMVGTRKCTDYGSKVAETLACELAEEGALVVSGMAEGIDTYSHKGALKAGAPTVAVLGCGVNTPYPRFNASLMKEIMETGMVVSEYPFNSEPKPWHFPERNRIIAGMSKATVVVEGEVKSGSIITANLASDFNRDVFAVPGNINSTMSKGPNALIKSGAYATVCAEDVLSHYRDVYGHLLKPVVREIVFNDVAEDNALPNDASDDKARVLSCIGKEPVHIDVICQKTGLSAAGVNSHLLILELEGKILSYAGNMYSLK